MPLTDLEICKKIAAIEDVRYIETKYEKDNFLGIIDHNDGSGNPPELTGEYNPLKDDALCFQLMVKYKIEPSFYKDEITGKLMSFTWIENKEGKTVSIGDYESLNLTICIAIIEANKD